MKSGADYQLSMSLDDEIAHFFVTGSLTSTAMDDLRAEGLGFLRESKAKAIVWEIRTKNTYPGIAEAYVRARNVPMDYRQVPSAIVDGSRNREFEAFYETTAMNAGLTVRYFSEVAAAKAWLKSRIEGRQAISYKL